MAANGISTLATKQLKQEAKLAIAAAKRQGKTVARNGTVSGNIDSTKSAYRENNYLLIDRLPAKYVGNIATDNKVDPLYPHRPWDVQPS
jgi:hypothetical protein